MSPAELLYAAVVVLVGLPAAFRNWTAAALVLSYVFMQGSYYGLGIVYPPIVSFLVDLTVIAVIYAKWPCCDLFPYRTLRAQFMACWLERSFWDRVVLVLFPVGWACYAWSADPWWSLYWISLAQLLAAGMEAFETYRSRTAKRVTAPDPPGSLFMYRRGFRPWVT